MSVFDSGSGSVYINDYYDEYNDEYNNQFNNDNIENYNIENFNKFNIKIIYYLIFPIIGIFIVCYIYNKCRNEIEQRRRPRDNEDNQSWDSFVAEMEGRMDAMARIIVESQQIDNIKTENSKRINKTVENENYLNINIDTGKDKYYGFSFNNDETECCICSEKLTETTKCHKTNEEYFPKLYMFPCGHTIHDSCYKDYKMSIIVNNDTIFKCPLCRK